MQYPLRTFLRQHRHSKGFQVRGNDLLFGKQIQSKHQSQQHIYKAGKNRGCRPKSHGDDTATLIVEQRRDFIHQQIGIHRIFRFHDHGLLPHLVYGPAGGPTARSQQTRTLRSHADLAAAAYERTHQRSEADQAQYPASYSDVAGSRRGRRYARHHLVFGGDGQS